MFVVFQNSASTNFVSKYCSYSLIGSLQGRSIHFFNIYNLQFTVANGEQFKTIKRQALYINYPTD